MTDRDSYYDELRGRRTQDGDAWKARGAAFVRWLKARPLESWLFFVAGLFLGGVFL